MHHNYDDRNSVFAVYSVEAVTIWLKQL